MTRREEIIREAAAAVVFIGWLILPAILVGAVTYFVLGFIINIIRTVYF
jgi:hypothetical protein